MVGSLGSQGNTLKASVMSGAVERVIYSGSSPCGNCTTMKMGLISPVAAAWTPAELNALTARVGFGSAATPQPYFSALMLEYATL